MQSYVDPRTPAGIVSLLERYQLLPKRQLGQHFLTDRHTLEAIAALTSGDVRSSDVLEIGSGPGGLTLSLLEQGRRVVAVEQDPAWKTVLESELGASFGEDRLTVVLGDALTLNWGTLQSELGLSAPLTIVGNLPYYITGPLLAKLWEDPVLWDLAVFMVQKEVADRLASPPGSRSCGVLGVLMRYVGEPVKRFEVSRRQFYPVPDVDSAVVEIVRRPRPSAQWKPFHWIVTAGFAHRRKMLRAALAAASPSWGKDDWSRYLQEWNIDPTRRAETLTLEEWVRLAENLASTPATGGERS